MGGSTKLVVTTVNDDRAGREIYIAIDPRCIWQTSLDIAITLAECLKVGIFAQLVSNNLLRQVAQLPFTTEILVSSGEEREFHSATVAAVEERKHRGVSQLLEQRAGLRRVSFRLETASEDLTLNVALEKRQDCFLPPLRSPAKPRGGNRGIYAVNWVYDNCAASERCLRLLQELIGAGLTRQVNLFANKPLPRQVISALVDCGARVCWVNSASGDELLAKLQSGQDADLLILPASYSAQIGDDKLRELNQHCSAPILVIA